MTETRGTRANTPRGRAGAAQGQKASQANKRRASSVPAVGSKKPELVLDCVLMTPRKRKRNSLLEDLPVNSSSSQGQRSRLASACPQKKTSTRSGRARARSVEKEAPAPSQRRSRSAKRASSPIPAPTKTPTRARSRSRTANDSSIAGPSSSPLRRATSRMSAAMAKAGLAIRIPASSRRNKGKGKALAGDLDSSPQADDDGWRDTVSSTSGARRSAKRRKLSPRPSPDTPASATTLATSEDVDMDSQQTAVEEDFDMVDIPDDACLPWVPVDPENKDSTYVPPGMSVLIEDMRRALVFERSAREKAEQQHAEELRRRFELEREAARLAEVNRALEAERSAWTSEAAETLASTLEYALVADMSRRLAGDVSTAAHLEEAPHVPEMYAATEPDTRYSVGGSPGPGVLEVIRDDQPFDLSEVVSTTTIQS